MLGPAALPGAMGCWFVQSRFVPGNDECSLGDNDFGRSSVVIGAAAARR